MEGCSSPKPVAPPAAADLMDVEPSNKLPLPTSNMSLLPVANGGGSSGGSRTPTFTFPAVNQDSDGSAKKSLQASTRRSTIIKIPRHAPPPQQEQSPTNEPRLSRISCRSLKEPILKRSMKEQTAPVAGEPQEPVLEMKQPQQQPAREMPRRQQPHREAAVKARTALTAADKDKAVVMLTASPEPKKKLRATETDNSVAQALTALSTPRKLELPKIRFELNKEEMEKDFMMMTGSKLPCPKKHPKAVEKKIKLITPGAYLPDLTMGRYTVRTRKCKKEMQRKPGLKGMMDDSSNSN